MTDTQRPIDPEVVGIMQEVMSQPGSTLFNVPTHAIGKPLRLRDEPVSVGAPFLSKAERHLLEVYRDEVADVLLQACRDKLTERPSEETMILRPDPEREESRRRRAAQVVRRADSDPASLFSMDESDRGLLSNGSAEQLAMRSIQISPSDEGRICMALGRRQSGAVDSAVATLAEVLLGPLRSPQIRSVAQSNLGLLHFDSGSLHNAQACYREASRNETEADAVVCWFTNAFLVGDQNDALEASGCLDRLNGEPALREHEDLLKSNPVRDRLEVSVEAREMWSRLGDRFSEPARRICRVFL